MSGSIAGKWLLPKQTTDAGAELKASPNLGLVFDKYSGKLKAEEDQLKFDKVFARDQIKEAAPARCTLDQNGRDRLAATLSRLRNLALACGGCARRYVTDSAFVTGLGIETPLENGMTLHPTLGVPYLPGTGVKGMVRVWAELWVDPPVADDAIARIFGPRLDAGAQGVEAMVGSVLFFDALPDASVRIEEDVMTPHYQEYYQRGATPGDWLNPNPIPFFVVPRGTTFTFPLAPRRRKVPGGGPLGEKHREGLDDLTLVCRWLEYALAFLGAGAKTKAGYGRFLPVELA